MSIRPKIRRDCSTRALKNLRYLQSVVPALIPGECDELDQVLPPADLARIHLPGYKPAPSASPVIAEILRSVKFPAVQDQAVAPLFNGTVYFGQFQITDTQTNITYSVAQADIETAIQYATLAAGPISVYASAYGPNSLAISPNILPFSVNLDGIVFQDADLQKWVNKLADDNQLPSITSCIVMLCPPEITNACSPLPNDIAYHQIARIPYIFVNLMGTGFTQADPDDFYAIALSHEIAEVTVDPLANWSNPEVCDACGSNFNNNYIDFFDQNGLYLSTTNKNGPPGLAYTSYNFYISAIVKPSGPFHSAAPPSHCNYAPPGFGNLLDGEHAFWIADFLGLGHDQIMTYYTGTGDWWLGSMQGVLLKWSFVSGSVALGNLLDDKHTSWIADFTGSGHAQLMSYSDVAHQWWLGNMLGGQLQWTKVSDTAVFGNLLDGKHPIWIADFTGAGHAQIMSYYSGTGDWWLGDMQGAQLKWSLVSHSANFGNLLDGKHPIWIADFTGAGHSQVMFYYSGDGHWWLGDMQGAQLNWSLVNQSAGFGNLLDDKHAIWIADFIGAGHAQVLFYYSVDGWWLGEMEGGQLNLTLVSQSSPFGNPLDGKHLIWVADFTGSGHAQLMLYANANHQWWLGNIDKNQLVWSLVGETAVFGNLLDGKHPVWIADFTGSGHAHIMSYYSGTGDWWLGDMQGDLLKWSFVSGNMAGFGNLLDSHHKIWLGDLQGVGHEEVFFYENVDTHWMLGNMVGATLGWSLVGATGS